jgi:hypothetical protein
MQDIQPLIAQMTFEEKTDLYSNAGLADGRS